MNRVLGCVLIALLGVGLACSKPSKKEEAECAASEKAATNLVVKGSSAERNEAGPRDGKAANAKAGTDFVANGSFEEWNEAGPKDWRIAAYNGKIKTWSPVKAQASPAAKSGKVALCLPVPLEKGYVAAAHVLDSKAIKPGVHAVVKAWVKAPAAQRLELVFSCESNGKKTRNAIANTKAGLWEELTLEVDIPKEVVPGSTRLLINRFGQELGEYLADEVSLKYAE